MSENLQNTAAKRVREVFANVNRKLRDHAVNLRHSSAATATKARLEIVSYAQGPVMEGYVEATLPNDDSVCWWLEVHWNSDSWVVEATLDRKSGDRQNTVKELPIEKVENFEEFLITIERVVDKLLTLDVDQSS